MSDADEIRFFTDYGKRKAGCRCCKETIEKGMARIAKCQPNYFNDGEGEMKHYHHLECMFEVFARGRSAKMIEDTSDLQGFMALKEADKVVIKKCLRRMHAQRANPKKKGRRKKDVTPVKRRGGSSADIPALTAMYGHPPPPAKKVKRERKKKVQQQQPPPSVDKLDGVIVKQEVSSSPPETYTPRKSGYSMMGIVKQEEDDIEVKQEDNDTDNYPIFSPRKPTPMKPVTTPSRKPISPSKIPAFNSTSSKIPAFNNSSSVAPPPQPPPSSSSVDIEPLKCKDNLFREFRRLCGMIADESSYNEKTKIIKSFVEKGTSGSGYIGDLFVFIKLLIPNAVKRVYNLQSRQLVKHFAEIFETNVDEMITDLEEGDVSETVNKFFQKSTACPPIKKSSLSIHDVDDFLTELSQYTKDEDQIVALTSIATKSTANDLKTIVRLIKCDLRITAGPKHVMDALDPNAHEAFKASKNLKEVIERIQYNKRHGIATLEVKASIMTPVAPMLAEACKSVEQAMKKCPHGMYSEIKYDGERVQLHMNNGKFEFFSRSLKKVQKHKVVHFDKYIPKAFPHGNSMIIDSEVLLVDNKTGSPLPFGTLGVHKKSQFKDASVCLFIFDLLHFNGTNMMTRPIKERRKFLEKNIKQIRNHVVLSEMKFINQPADLKEMICRVIKEGLEGLVLKDVNGIYEPGKRHWLKVKKDYLMQGRMADTADLVVLGAYFGTGVKGGMMSIFLMGVYDEQRARWVTVTKVANGHTDQALEKINRELKTVKICKDYSRVPQWLHLNRQLTPDFVVSEPTAAPVWEITGTEFSKAETHTADGISIRFPRVTKIRTDKNWRTATSLKELKVLYTKSKEESDVSLLMNDSGSSKKKGSKKEKPSSVKKAAPVLQEPTRPHGKKDFVVKKEYSNKELLEVAKDNTFLNDLFTGCKIYIPDMIENYDLLNRYVVAQNGDVLSHHQIDKATHVVMVDVEVDDDASWPETAIVLTEDYLWDCIKSKRRLCAVFNYL